MRKLRILFIDIEATDLTADIGNLLSIGYKFNDEKDTHVMDIQRYPGKKINDDSKLLEAFRPIIEQADILVHHFGDYYDVPFLQTRLLVHKLKPYPGVRTVDTWRIAKKKLKFGSNRLERILEVLGCPYRKTPVKLSVWADARVGDRRALQYIIKHNYWDVRVLEWVYNRIAPVWERHPRVVLSDDSRICAVCGGRAHSKGRVPCEKRVYQRMICYKCGKTWRGKEVTND